MIDPTLAILNVLSFATAAALVLWGLRLFRIYISLIGFCVGAVLGSLAGAALAVSADGAVVGALLGGCVGAAVAWPLQKLAVFIVAGIWTAVGGIVLLSVLGLARDAWAITAVILFFAGGAIAMRVYEYVIIVTMAFGAGQTIFTLALPPRRAFDLRSLGGYFETLVEHLARYAVGFVLVTAVTVLFALFFQKRLMPRSRDDASQVAAKRLFRRVTYRFALLAITGTALVAVGSATRRFGLWSIVGVDEFSWMPLAVITFYFLPSVGRSIRHPAGRWGALVAFGLATPLVTWLLFSVLRGEVVGLRLFYGSLLSGPSEILLLRWAYYLVGFPLLMFGPLEESAAVDESALVRSGGAPLQPDITFDSAPGPPHTARSLEGIGGWVAVLLITLGLGVLSNLLSLVALVNDRPIFPYPSGNPDLLRLVILLAAVAQSLGAIWAIRAGLQKRREFVNAARAVFYIGIASALFVMLDLTAALSRIPGRVNGTAVFTLYMSLAVPLAVAMAWLQYLRTSRRVRLTFTSAGARQTATSV